MGIWRKDNKADYNNILTASNITGSSMICKDDVCKVDTVFFERKHVPVITNRGFSDAFSQAMCKEINEERAINRL
jgi:hypothetical protein